MLHEIRASSPNMNQNTNNNKNVNFCFLLVTFGEPFFLQMIKPSLHFPAVTMSTCFVYFWGTLYECFNTFLDKLFINKSLHVCLQVYVKHRILLKRRSFATLKLTIFLCLHTQYPNFLGDTITFRYTGPVESWRNIVQIVRKEYDLEKYFYFLFLSIIAFLFERECWMLDSNQTVLGRQSEAQ